MVYAAGQKTFPNTFSQFPGTLVLLYNDAYPRSLFNIFPLGSIHTYLSSGLPLYQRTNYLRNPYSKTGS